MLEHHVGIRGPLMPSKLSLDTPVNHEHKEDNGEGRHDKNEAPGQALHLFIPKSGVHI